MEAFEQFQNAMLVNGGDIETASVSDYLLHFITFGLKVVTYFWNFNMIMMHQWRRYP